MYDSVAGEGKAGLMVSMVTETLSFQLIRHFANAWVDTKWPTAGAGMKISSNFFIVPILLYVLVKLLYLFLYVSVLSYS